VAQNKDKQQGFKPETARSLSAFAFVVFVLGALGWGLVAFGGSLAGWLTPLVPMSVDRTLGEASQQQLSATQSECTNPLAKKYIEELAAPLQKAAGPLPFEFSFRVVDSSEVNAFALPGGFVTVNWGLVEAAESGEEIAGVIGHEIQHALLRHGTKRILRQVGTGALLSLVLGGTDFHAYGQAAAGLTHLSYDRDQESEADEQGVALMRASGINPAGLATFFARLAKNSPQPPTILSTHPDPGDRARLVSAGAADTSYKALPAPSGITCHPPQ
jgi:predicted Zn-dependent protease